MEKAGDVIAHLAGIIGGNPVEEEQGSEYGSLLGMDPSAG
jgi:hypothetical protein